MKIPKYSLASCFVFYVFTTSYTVGRFVLKKTRGVDDEINSAASASITAAILVSWFAYLHILSPFTTN
jgi:prolipoprotein diacylglyceryltransferase